MCVLLRIFIAEGPRLFMWGDSPLSEALVFPLPPPAAIPRPPPRALKGEGGAALPNRIALLILHGHLFPKHPYTDWNISILEYLPTFACTIICVFLLFLSIVSLIFDR